MTTTPWRGSSSPQDVILSGVAHEHRRAVLHSLHHAAEESLGIEALTDQVAERVRAGDPPGRDHRRRVRSTLHHVHLPKLEESGMVVYDADTKQVSSATDGLGTELLAVLASHDGPE